MNMIIPDEGKLKILDMVFREPGIGEGFFVTLFTAPAAVNDTNTFEAYTTPSFEGAGPIAIARADWAAAVIVGERGTLLCTKEISWTMTSGTPETVYGWVLYGDTTDIIYAGQTFDTPRDFVIGATLKLEPFQIQDKSIED